MIFVTGDIHGITGIHRLNSKNFKKQEELNRNDYLIVLGDFDILSDFDLLENYCINKLKKRNYTILFIDGNHENFKKLNKYNTEEWNGGKVHKIKDNIT